MARLTVITFAQMTPFSWTGFCFSLALRGRREGGGEKKERGGEGRWMVGDKKQGSRGRVEEGEYEESGRGGKEEEKEKGRSKACGGEQEKEGRGIRNDDRCKRKLLWII